MSYTDFFAFRVYLHCFCMQEAVYAINLTYFWDNWRFRGQNGVFLGVQIHANTWKCDICILYPHKYEKCECQIACLCIWSKEHPAVRNLVFVFCCCMRATHFMLDLNDDCTIIFDKVSYLYDDKINTICTSQCLNHVDGVNNISRNFRFTWQT